MKDDNPVKTYFLYDATNKTSQCKVEGCKEKPFSGSHSSNLERHLERKHPDEFKKLKKIKENRPAAPLSATKVHSALLKDNLKVDTFFKSELPKVSTSLAELKSACVEMVTVNGRPFTAIDDSGFRKILDPILNAVNSLNRTKDTISAANIKSLIPTKCEEFKNQIIEETTGIMISLKVDAATRLHRSFLGINIQFLKLGKIEIRTLAVRELKERHTAIYLKRVIKDVLDEYSINLNQIYTITSDNGANMVKCVDLLETDLIIESDYQKHFSNCDEIFDDLSDDPCEEILEKIEEAFRDVDEEESGILHSIRCGCHTLQLAVFDFIKKEKTVDKNLAKARHVVKLLRTPNINMLLKVKKKSFNI